MNKVAGMVGVTRAFKSLRHIWLVVSVAFILACGSSQPPASGSLEQAVTEFLRAFNNLDWPAFQRCFAPDATLFNPDIPKAASVHRLEGREAIERNFRAVFEATRQQSNGPPYMHIVPQALRIQAFGAVAVATFEFGRSGGSLGRRTLVFVWREGRWLIAHLHASNVKAP